MIRNVAGISRIRSWPRRGDRALAAGRTDRFVKLIAAPRRMLGNLGGRRIVGATIVAERAGEMIHEPALAMATGMFTGRLAAATHAYPTWSHAVQLAAAQFFMSIGGRRARLAQPAPAAGEGVCRSCRIPDRRAEQLRDRRD